MPIQAPPDFFRMALDMKQMRMREAADKESTRINRINAISKANAAEAKSRRDDRSANIKEQIDLAKLRDSLRESSVADNQIIELGRNQASAFNDAASPLLTQTPLSDALNPAATDAAFDRVAGTATQVDRASQDILGPGRAILDARAQGRAQAFGTDQETARRNALTSGQQASDIEDQMRARKAQIELAKVTEAEDRKERRKIDEENRTEQFKVASEERAFANSGKWTGSDLSAHQVREQKALAPIVTLNQDWAAVEKAQKRGNRFDALELIQRWVRNVDPGATVREGDIALLQHFGASGYADLKAKWEGFTDAEKKISDALKPALIESFVGILSGIDEGFAGKISDIDEYADRQRWNDAERRRAIPVSTASRRLLKRISDREQRGVDVENVTPPTRDEFDNLLESLVQSTGLSPEDVPDELVRDLWKARQIGGSN